MKTSMTWLLTVIFALFLTAGATRSVDAQGLKIGFLKDDQIYQKYTAFQKAQEQWELEKRAWDEEALSKQEELQDLIDAYEKQKLILSDDKKREREAAINAKRDFLDAYTKQVFGPQGTAETKYTQLIEPLLESIHRAIEAVAVEGNYDVIFTLQGIGYIKDQYDVTEQVLNYLEESGE